MTREDPAIHLVPGRDFMELVWENGSILMRGRTTTSNQNRNISSSSYRPPPSKADEEEARSGFGLTHYHHRFIDDASTPNDDYSRQFETPASLLGTGFHNSNHNLLPSTDGFSLPSSRSSGETKRANFSHFLGLGFPIKDADNRSSTGIRSTRDGTNPTEIETDKDQVSSQKQPVRAAPAGTEAEVAGAGVDFLVPDEHSQAISNNFIEDQRVLQSSTLHDDYQVPVTDSSIDVSEHRCKLKRRRFDESETTYPDDDEDEEHEDHKRRTAYHAGRSATGAKRSRSTIHSLSEKKRRDKINKRLRALQELLPNCSKVDKASVLDEAIEYMKTLQLQLQIMSTRNRLFASPMAMLPLPYLNQFSPMGTAGMGLRMGPGFAQAPAHQFPIQGPGSSAALAGGFQPMGCMPYLPLLGGHPALSPLVNGVDFSRAATSIPTSGSNDLNQSKYSSEAGYELER